MVEPIESGTDGGKESPQEGGAKQPVTLNDLLEAFVRLMNQGTHGNDTEKWRKKLNKKLDAMVDAIARISSEQGENNNKYIALVERYELLKKQRDEEELKRKVQEEADRRQKEAEEKRKVEEEQKRAKEEADKRKLKEEEMGKNAVPPKPPSVFTAPKFSAASSNNVRGFFAGIGGKKSLSGRLFHLLGADYMHEGYNPLFPAKPVETQKPETPKSDVSKPETPKSETQKAEAAKTAATGTHDEKITKEHPVQKPAEKEHKTIA